MPVHKIKELLTKNQHMLKKNVIVKPNYCLQIQKFWHMKLKRMLCYEDFYASKDMF